ncbi:D-alanine--D-alanine ligase family protein [Varibaculum prostatecancerukia]|uniref:D-alanine--D-alanine ligase family protein n=1 Tax=Varibaculum prostatecancerukia TaxID=2811781 RepID=UPI001C00205B|nr:D-alanine--D-alanine ligase family protein [Varibaculum prostatecancerukia]
MTPSDKSKPRVLVLFGGESGEHGISCATAAGVVEAIDHDRFEVVTVGITPQGQWVPVDFSSDQFQISEEGVAQVPAANRQLFLSPGDGHVVSLPTQLGPEFSLADLGSFDVVFPLLHGPFGEDGTVQGLLEMMHLPYVGCGVLASAAAMDKPTTKILLHEANLPAGRWETVTASQWSHDRSGVLERLAHLGLPVFVKPARAGSSLGITKVSNADAMEAAVIKAQAVDPRVIVEQELTGFEVECAVLQGADGRPRTTEPGKIAMRDDVVFYDYKTKYFGEDSVSLEIPAKIPEHLATQVREIAAKAFEALGCEGLARVDFFVDPEKDSVVINEVNTMPGFTPFSMYPKLWEHMGIGYSQLMEELISLALARPVGLR